MNSCRTKQVFAIIAKYPLQGLAKTRLAKELGDELAVELYKGFLRDFFRNLSHYWKQRPVCIFVAPGESYAIEYFSKLALTYNIDATIYPQPVIPFFQRLSYIFHKINTDLGPCTVHLTGTDIPDFPFHYIDDEFTGAFCLGPDEDGGFYYAKLESSMGDIFDIDSILQADSQCSVLDAILAKGKELNLTPKLLKPWGDIDHFNDLKQCLGRSAEKGQVMATLKIFNEHLFELGM